MSPIEAASASHRNETSVRHYPRLVAHVHTALYRGQFESAAALMKTGYDAFMALNHTSIDFVERSTLHYGFAV